MAPGVLVLGATSLVGSHFVDALSDRVPIEAAGRIDPRTRGLRVREFHPVDLSDREAVLRLLGARPAGERWINFVARTDVDGCEAERPASPPGVAAGRSDSAWTMNAELPGWIAAVGRERGCPLIHLSTDFVFDGSAGPYPETEEPSPWGPKVGWYGYTKGVGERRVRAMDPGATIVRVSYPYRASYPERSDFARNLLTRAEDGTLYPLYNDQRITPTWIPDVTRTLERLLDGPEPGTVHVAAPDPTTPWEFGTELCRVFRVPGPAPVAARLSDVAPSPARAPRPILGGLRTDRIVSLGLRPTGFREGIRAMAQVLSSRSLDP